MPAREQPSVNSTSHRVGQWIGYITVSLLFALIWCGLLSVASHPETLGGEVAIYLLVVGTAVALRRGQIHRAMAKLRATCLPPDPAVVSLVQRLCPVDPPDVLQLPPPADSIWAHPGGDGRTAQRKRRAASPQAAALGGGHGPRLVVYTAALTARLTAVEQTAVLAHEMVHLRHGDSHAFVRARALQSVVLTLSLALIAGSLLDLHHPLAAFAWTWCESTLAAAGLQTYRRSREARADREAEALISDPAILGIALAEIDQGGTDPGVRKAVLDEVPGDVVRREQLETSLAMAAAEAHMRAALAAMRPPRYGLFALLTLDHPPTTRRILDALAATASPAATATDARVAAAEPGAGLLAVAAEPSSPGSSRGE